MNDSVRLENAIYARLRMRQAMIEYKRAEREFESYILMSEMKGPFDYDSCKQVMINLSKRADLEIKPACHVGSTLRYKDASV